MSEQQLSPEEWAKEHDTKLIVWLDDPNDPRCKQMRDSLVRHLRARGFAVRLDRETKRHYASISPNYHEGNKGQLQFKMNMMGRCIEICFYQSVVFENRNGGQYDFDKRKKMPYLIGKQYEVERRHIAALLATFGFGLRLDVSLRGMAFINERRAQLSAFQGKNFYERPWESYNTTSAAKRTISDGDRVCFRYYDGRIRFGTAYRNINNMWWVLLPCGTVWNVASFEIWHRLDLLAPVRGRAFDQRHIERRLRDQLKKAIATEAFERAAVLRDVIRRKFPVQETRAAA